ncbi:3545_t:CDS:10 [Ambispora leptoticha]|uniref:3545_t:CDS:1 n=1 Tax=Ambispora leptoticha TaxID=144679 RepID=A0A9N9DXD7_9GLOM|nr:3545_t:CDS:10 [Ambispora leptoticha]
MAAIEKLIILLVGSGGREHALAWKLAQSPLVEAIFVAPGNGGTAKGLDKVSNVNIGVGDFSKLTEFALKNQVNFVVPGPEQPLVEGIQSNFSDYEKAKAYLNSISHNVVIKASGLAGGKGVLIPTNKQEAFEALKELMVDRAFGAAGDDVVIEEFLEGQELSVLSFSDGYTIIPLPPAQDHKRIFDGDLGPNTGGMGCYCPTPIATPELISEIKNTILIPTITGMRQDGFPFVGMLFTGLMITSSGPKVLEYNVRFGDPETETVLPLLSEDTDLAEIMLACTEGRLDSVHLSTKPVFATTVIIAAGGYPGNYSKGKEITIHNISSDALIFHAGTSILNNKLVTSGGRVLAVSGVASTLREAVDKAYETVKLVNFENMFYRNDIAHRAFKYLTEKSIGNDDNHVMTYESAGVSIDSGNQLVNQIRPLIKLTKRRGSISEIGGFGGLFDLKEAGYDDPILVSTTDGVGTKLKIAQAINKFDTIGIDLVAMSVNDLLVQGAEPLFFLDYYACGKLHIDVAKDVVKGVVEGCLQSNCALIGGETAEMPGVYNVGEYKDWLLEFLLFKSITILYSFIGEFDLAGFAVGAVNRKEILPRTPEIQAGDLLLGLSSSGVHSNGFSLIRKVINKYNLEYTSPCPWDPKKTLGESLLTPTRIYVRQLLPVIKKGLVKAMAHITGGGFVDNIPRVLPDNIGAIIDTSKWTLPEVFKWMAHYGNIPYDELFRTFNCGIGIVLVVSPENIEETTKLLQNFDAQTVSIGSLINVKDNERRVTLKGINDN